MEEFDPLDLIAIKSEGDDDAINDFLATMDEDEIMELTKQLETLGEILDLNELLEKRDLRLEGAGCRRKQPKTYEEYEQAVNAAERVGEGHKPDSYEYEEAYHKPSKDRETKATQSYKEFIRDCISDGKTLTQCAREWKQEEEEAKRDKKKPRGYYEMKAGKSRKPKDYEYEEKDQ